MDVDIDGLIQLLAKSLYSKAEVFVRELLQNAHDAIQMRAASGSHVAGRIDVRVDPAQSQIVFSDNGIGMDEADVRQFLAVIGASNKPDYRERLRKAGRGAEQDVVGQFGIGLLSAFVVADKIIVRTLKVGSREAWEWENNGSASYTLRRTERSEPGTDVVLTIRRDGEDFLHVPRVEKAARHYMAFLPVPIYVNGDGPINDVNPPWHRRWTSASERDHAYHAFINQRFPDFALDVMPVEVESPKIRGVLYISSESLPTLESAGLIDLYVRRVLVLGRDATILPRWARFVAGVIDVPDIKVVASRENVLREDETFAAVQRELGEIVLKRMRWLAENDPRHFERITTYHSFSLLTMALTIDAFFDVAKDLLLLPTNRGAMNLQNYIKANRAAVRDSGHVPIYYAVTEGADSQFFSIGQKRGWVVINASGYLIEPFLKRYAAAEGTGVVLVALEHEDVFDKPTADMLGASIALERDVDIALREVGIHVRVRTRVFEPASIPGLVSLTPKTAAQKEIEALQNMRGFLTGFREVADVARESRERESDLVINLANPVVNALLHVDRRDPACFDVMVSLYSCALLGSRGLLNERTAPIVGAHLQRLLTAVLKSHVDASSLRDEVNDLKEQLAEARRESARHSGSTTLSSGVITVFMCTPYEDRYEPVEQAVRSVLEKPPYFFRVRLARDFILSPIVHSSVIEHIRQADAFIADVSENNPNVMFELGAAVLTERPIFLLRSGGMSSVLPIDLGNRLWIDYPTGAPLAQITAAIRAGLERNGRPAHASLQELLARRRVYGLSRALFESLQVRLADDMIDAILRRYETLTDFLEADIGEVASQTGIRQGALSAIREELSALVSDSVEP